MPGSSFHEVLQARIVEWVAIPFCSWSSPPREQTQVSCAAGRFLYQLSHRWPLGCGSKSNRQWCCPPLAPRAFTVPGKPDFSEIITQLNHSFAFMKTQPSFHACSVASFVPDSATLWTVAHQAPLSMGFSRQEYWSWLPCPPPGDLPNPGIEPIASPVSSALQADSLPLSHLGSPQPNLAFYKHIHLRMGSNFCNLTFKRKAITYNK